MLDGMADNVDAVTSRNPFVHPVGVLGAVAGWVMGRDDRPHRELADLLAPGPAASICEIGFGPGQLLAVLAARDPTLRLCGVDPSPVMLRQARRRLAAVDTPAVRDGRPASRRRRRAAVRRRSHRRRHRGQHRRRPGRTWRPRSPRSTAYYAPAEPSCSRGTPPPGQTGSVAPSPARNRGGRPFWRCYRRSSATPTATSCATPRWAPPSVQIECRRGGLDVGIGHDGDAVTAHPAVVALFLTHRHTGISVMRCGEVLLRILAAAGFTGSDRVIAFRTLLAYLGRTPPPRRHRQRTSATSPQRPSPGKPGRQMTQNAKRTTARRRSVRSSRACRGLCQTG